MIFFFRVILLNTKVDILHVDGEPRCLGQNTFALVVCEPKVNPTFLVYRGATVWCESYPRSMSWIGSNELLGKLLCDNKFEPTTHVCNSVRFEFTFFLCISRRSKNIQRLPDTPCMRTTTPHTQLRRSNFKKTTDFPGGVKILVSLL